MYIGEELRLIEAELKRRETEEFMKQLRAKSDEELKIMHRIKVNEQKENPRWD